MARPTYQVLARKWRPQQFDDVVGQRPVVRTLVNALQQQRLAHAYCFSGIRGVGKTTIARLLAKGLNCRSFEGPTATPCGTCESCVEIMEGRSLDVFERDAASDRGINEMKELIEIARYSPSRDRYKVMILDEAHMLTADASNALLKVLEEPPEYIVFALATTEPNKILPTILSRCQHYQLSRISQREIEEHLAKIATAENIAISADGLALVATAADGSLRDAQTLLDKLIAFAGESIDEATVVDLLGLVDRVLLFRAVDLIAAEDVAGVLGLVNEMVQQGIDLHQFAVDLLGHIRNLLVVRTVDEPGEILHLPVADLEMLTAQAAHFEIDDLDRAFTLLAGSEYRIKMAEQPRYHLEVILARLARMPRLQPVEDLIAILQGGEPSGSAPRGGGGGRGRKTTPPKSTPTAATPAPAASAAPTPAPTAPEPEAEAIVAAPEPEIEPVPAPPPVAAPEPTPVAATPEIAPDPEPTPAPVAPDPAPAPTPVAAVVEPEPSPEPPVVQPEPIPAPAVAEPAPVAEAAAAPTSGLLAKVQAKLSETHPLVAQSLSRTCGIDLAGEALVFRFPPTAGLFADRFKDPDIKPALRAACEATLGRSVAPRVEIDPNAPPPTPKAKPVAPAQPLPPEPNAVRAASPQPPDDDIPHPADAPPASHASPPNAAASAPASAPSPAQTAPPAPEPTPPAEPRPVRTPASPELRRQVENDPGVQQLLGELKGSVLSVEEIQE